MILDDSWQTIDFMRVNNEGFLFSNEEKVNWQSRLSKSMLLPPYLNGNFPVNRKWATTPRENTSFPGDGS